MGANAQTSVPTFTAGEILTAANMNISARTGIPVFADSTARDAAFGGTGEKTLAEGQYAYLESTNATQVYDGSNWQTVGASGLTFVAGATFSNVATVTFANSTFSSTYSNYLVQLEANAASASTLTMQFRDNNGTKSAASYYGAFSTLIYTGTSGTVLSSGTTSAGIGSASSNQGFYTFFVGRPNEAVYYPIVTMTGWGQDRSFTGGFVYLAAEAMTGLVISATVNITGKYKVYGLANS